MAGASKGIVYGTGPTFGTDGPIPHKYLTKVYTGIQIAWALGSNSRFVQVWRKTVGELSNQPQLSGDSYGSALNSMCLNLAETSRNPYITREIRGLSHLEGSSAEPAPALTIVSLGRTWLRLFLLEDSARRIAGNIMHECAHYAGAPAHVAAEFLLMALDHASGLPR